MAERMMKKLRSLKAFDYYKKIPRDLAEATLTGAWLSLAAAAIITTLFIMEFTSFLSASVETTIIVDKSSPSELMRLNFNISFPLMSCEFASVDVSDALGTRRMNLTHHIRKAPITSDLRRAGAPQDMGIHKQEIKYDEEGSIENPGFDIDIEHPLTPANFQATLDRYPIVVVNFFAPWCIHCQRLEPSWTAATQLVHEKYPESDGRIRFAKVDCTVQADMCRDHLISAFPSIRVFRRGHDDIYVHGIHDHETYIGHRTKDALVAFADSLAPSAGQPHRKHADLVSSPKSAGCNLSGFVLVKRVPGTLHITARSADHSFDHGTMNMSHHVHALSFGFKPTPHKYHVLRRLHPEGLNIDWQDKLHDNDFVSVYQRSTHEHFLQVVQTTVEPFTQVQSEIFDAYEYTVHSNVFETRKDDPPSVQFSFALSPLQIIIHELPKHWYHFTTTTCAIIGGVFTVAGILDAILCTTYNVAKKKMAQSSSH